MQTKARVGEAVTDNENVTKVALNSVKNYPPSVGSGHKNLRFI